MAAIMRRAFTRMNALKVHNVTATSVGCVSNGPRFLCLSAPALNKSVAQVLEVEPAPKKKSLVIFDKDGTLICLHTMYGPWRHRLVENLERHSGLDLAAVFDQRFGYCSKTEKLMPGLLAEATHDILQEDCRRMLVDLGLSEEKARDIVEKSWVVEHGDCDTEVKTLGDLVGLFEELRENDIKIAICTSDSRETTRKTLNKLGLEKYIDKIVCGDDATSMPKPSPHNALMICDALQVHPSQAVVVGDSLSDMHMGKGAKLGSSIAVSTGCGSSDYLEPHSDFVVDALSDILPLVLPDNTSTVGQAKASLVIFDSHGTLLDFHHTWAPFVINVAEKLQESTGLDLQSEIYGILGYNPDTDRMVDGCLAYGTEMEAIEKLANLLRQNGINRFVAKQKVMTAWSDLSRNWKSLDDISLLFQTLKHYGIKIAICTSDNREWTERVLEQLHVRQYVDTIVCGDDIESQPKPSPYNVARICEELDASENNTVLVGDTIADVGMGRLANIGKVVGVLSGLGTKEDLDKHADMVVDSVNDVLPIILPQCHRQVITGLRNKRQVEDGGPLVGRVMFGSPLSTVS